MGRDRKGHRANILFGTEEEIAWRFYRKTDRIGPEPTIDRAGRANPRERSTHWYEGSRGQGRIRNICRSRARLKEERAQTLKISKKRDSYSKEINKSGHFNGFFWP